MMHHPAPRPDRYRRFGVEARECSSESQRPGPWSRANAWIASTESRISPTSGPLEIRTARVMESRYLVNFHEMRSRCFDDTFVVFLCRKYNETATFNAERMHR